MTIENKHFKDRRQLLKWTPPVIASVLLPQHARASSPNEPPLQISIRNEICTMSGGRTFLSYELTNNESIEVAITTVAVAIAGGAYVAQPTPTTILPAQSATFGFDDTANTALSCSSGERVSIEVFGYRPSGSRIETTTNLTTTL